MLLLKPMKTLVILNLLVTSKLKLLNELPDHRLTKHGQTLSILLVKNGLLLNNLAALTTFIEYISQSLKL